MKRRELIKGGLLGLGVSALGLTGCKKEEVAQQKAPDEFTIIPKQTATYEFSVPMPFDYETIDKIVKLNSKLKKSKVNSLYNGAVEPLSHNFNHWVHLSRGGNAKIKTYDDFFKYVDYAHKNGFEFTYLMNSPKSFSERDFDTFKDEFFKLLDSLIKHNVKNIKVASTQVASIIQNYAPNKFTLSASCAFEYKNVNQYKQLFSLFPNFDCVDMAYDENQNFKLLKSLRDDFPKIKFELMVNEACAKGCAMRACCIPEMDFIADECNNTIMSTPPMQYFTKSGMIYPWNLKYYSAIGVNNFKYVALGTDKSNYRDNYHDIGNLKTYLKVIELEDEAYKEMTAYDFFAKILDSPRIVGTIGPKKLRKVKLAKLMEVLPNVEHFVKYGSECNYRCGSECNYCIDCAKKLDKLL